VKAKLNIRYAGRASGEIHLLGPVGRRKLRTAPSCDSQQRRSYTRELANLRRNRDSLTEAPLNHGERKFEPQQVAPRRT